MITRWRGALARLGLALALVAAAVTLLSLAHGSPARLGLAQDAATPVAEATAPPTPTAGPRVKAAGQVQAAALSNLTITLALSPVSPIAAGASQTAQASWSSAPAGKPTGTVTYTVFNGTGCTGTQFAGAGAMTISALGTYGSVAASNAVAFPSAGGYSWQAAYGGDANYNPASVCSNLTVNKATPTLTLATTPASPAAAGTSIAASATLVGASPIAGGTVTYTVYSNSTCSTTYTITGSPSAVTVANAVAPNSTALVFNTAGTFYWKAVYSGDANDNTASSACLALTVSKTNPTLTLGLTASAITAGGSTAGAATLTGATSVAGGTVTYTVYSDSACAAAYTVTGSPSAKTVANGVVPNSATIAFNTAGTYYWKASYGGDGGNNSAVSACVPLTVALTSPTLSLTTTPAGSVATTFTATGSATLSGATSVAGGTVTYTVYTDSACATVYSATGNPSAKTVTNGVPAASAAIAIGLAPGSVVYWQAVYSGDGGNGGATSPCLALNVVKASPTLNLTLSKTAIKTAATAYGKTTLTNSTATAGGTVTYSVYSDNACATLYVAANNPSVKTVANKVVPNATAVTFNLVGTFYWRAVYSGDANNNGATSACVAITVTASTPTITLTAAATSSPLKAGGSAYAKLSMTAATTTAGGTVTYTVYTDSACATLFSAANNPNSVTVTNKVAPNSAKVTVTAVGTIYWKAVYSGDANNGTAASACVAQTVSQATPTLALAVAASAPPMAAGGTATGTATFTLSSGMAGGALTYTVYSDSACSAAMTTPGSPSAVTVAGSVAPSSAPVTLNVVGTVYWRAAYAGDANNAAATSACVAFAVAKASPTLTLSVAAVNPPMRAGGTAAGSVAFANATADAGGAVTYTVYTTNACATQVSPPLTSTKTVSNASAPASDAFAFNAIGTYYWRAAYGGDAKNNAATSACVGFTVAGEAQSILTLTLAPNPATVGGSVIGDSNLSGTTPDASGTVVYTVYSDAACATPVSPAQSSTVTVANANPPDSAPMTFTTVGTYYVSAYYNSDANNSDAVSACIALPVNKTAPTLALSLAPNPVEAGANAIASATLTGAVNAPSGTIVYTAYANNVCGTAVNPSKTSTVAVANGAAPSSGGFAFAAIGTYYWQAVYSGDPSNGAATSPCVSLSVVKATPDLLVTQIPLPVNVGDNFKGHLALSSDAINATGTATIRYYSDPTCATAAAGLSPYTSTLSNGQIPDAPTFVYTYPDGLFLQGTYSGDANNAGDVSDCYQAVIADNLPLSVTIAPAATITRGGSASAQAAWPGSEAPTGTITYAAYASADCTGTALSTPETKPIASGAVAASSAVVFANAGAYSWKASYSGDSLYNPTTTCAALTVAKNATTVALSIQPSPIQAGQSAAGAATLSGGATGGTVIYNVYVNSSCATAVSPAKTSTVTVTNGVAPSSSAFAFTQTGIFYWRADYSGDSNSAAASSPCVSLAVTSAASSISLGQSPAAVAVGASFTTQMALNGAVNPTGAVTLTRYGDSGCATQLASVNPVVLTLANGQIPDAPALAYTFGGQIWQRAVYSGDANNAPAASACVAVVLSPGPLTVSVSNADLSPATYSNAATVSAGQIVIGVSDLRASWAGWTVTLSSTDFAYGGSSPIGAAIPAANFSVAGAPSVAVISGQPAGAGGPAAASAVGSLNQTRALATAATGYGSGAYQITAPVSLAIPARSQAGSYAATITVAISAGP